MAFLALFALGTTFGWMARIAWDSRENAAAAETLKQLQQRAQYFPDYTEFSKLTNKELKEETLSFTETLESFQLEFKAAMDAGGKAGIADGSPYDKGMELLRLRFDREFRPIGLALREEMIRRIPKDAIKEPLIPVFALDFGGMMGTNPIGDVAARLQYLAGLLAE